MPVPAALAPYVTSLVAYDVAMAGPGVHRGLPSTEVTFVLPLGEPLSVGWGGGVPVTGWSCVSGLHPGPAEIHHDGHQRGVQLALSTTGARALFGVPAGELSGRLLGLADVGGPLRHLPEQLAETPFEHSADLVARVVADALGRAGDVRPRAEVARALAGLTRGHPVQAVADEVGYSRRHLATLVREETGLPPRQLRRIARFAQARSLLGRLPLADVAARCGYADQAHLSRDWRDLAGCTPTTWMREELPFVQDADHLDGAGCEHDLDP